MDPSLIRALPELVVPVVLFLVPVAIVFVNKYFKLKHRELDVEAELQKKWTEESRKQLEARVGSLESAMGAVLQIVAPRPQQPVASQAQLAQSHPLTQTQPLSQAQQLAALSEPPGAAPAQQAGSAQPDPLGRRERG